MLSEEVLEKMLARENRFWKKYDGDDVFSFSVNYISTEADTVRVVRDVIGNLIDAMHRITWNGIQFDARRLSFRCEADISSLKCEYWVVLDHNRIVGVIEVKKDGQRLGDGAKALSNANVPGQLYDYMRLIECLHGTEVVFGIVTTYNYWRVCWRGEIEGNQKRMPETPTQVPRSACQTPKQSPFPGFETPISKESEETEKQEKRKSPVKEGVSSQLEASELVLVEEEDETKEEGEKEDFIEEDENKRVLFASEIVSCEDTKKLCGLVGGALLQMCCAGEGKKVDFKNLTQKVILGSKEIPRPFMFFRRESPHPSFGHLPSGYQGLQMGLFSKNKTASVVYVLDDLGSGADGRVHLVCSAKGIMSVFKFVRSEERARQEAVNWTKVYGDVFKVRVEKWIQSWVVVMPRFQQFRSKDERENSIGLVQEVLKTKFAGNKLKHRDVKWRNIGYYLEKNEKQVVVFDLASVTKDSSKDWVEESMEYLKDAM